MSNILSLNSGGERGQAPSCSSFKRYAQCHGSYQLALGLPDSSGADAQLGTDVHLALSGGDIVLSDEGEMLRCMCAAAYSKLATEVIGADGPMLSYFEERLWFGKREWSGQADRIDIFNDTSALVVDYKTGRGAVDPAESNVQLRGLAVLAKHRFPFLTQVFVAIIAPMSCGTTVAMYDEEMLALAQTEMVDLVARISAPGATKQLAPSASACKYCRAKTVCPAVRVQALAVLEEPEYAVALDNEKLADYLAKAEYIEDFIVALRQTAKERLSKGEVVPGWTLSPGRTTRNIPDATAAFSLLADTLGGEEFASACKVSVPSLEKAYAKAKGLKGKAAKEEFEAAMASVIETKASAPMLTQTKEAA
jgi:hypothetical protein